MAGKSKFSIVAEDATAAAWKSVANNAKQTADQISHVWETAFAGISVAVVAELGMKAFEVGDQFSKAATKAGIGGKAFTELAYAAKLADVDVDALSTSIKKMQVSLSEAASGAKAPNDDLRALGLTLEDLKGIQADQQLELIGDRISQLKDPADRTRAAVDLFGRSGADLLPLFEQGAAGIRKARAEAEKLGVALDDTQLKKLADGEDAVRKLEAAWQGVYLQIATKAAPALTDFLEHLSGVTSIETQIRDAENHLNNHSGDFGMDLSPTGDERAALERRIAFLKLKQEALSEPALGGRGRSNSPEGFAAINKADNAAAAEKKADAASAKLVDQFMKNQDEFDNAFDKQMDEELKSSNEAWTEQMIAWNKFEEGRQAKEEETNQAISHMREEQAAASAQQYVDIFDNAFNAMEASGKLSVGRLAKYVIAELAQKAIANLIGKLFSSSGSGGSSIAGSAAGSIVGALFGGARANGGDVLPGRSYLVGERGPELVRFGARGSVTPNKALGGVALTQHVTYNVSGSNEEQLRKIGKMQEDNNRRLMEQLERRHKFVSG